VPTFCVITRKAYGLGAQGMGGGSHSTRAALPFRRAPLLLAQGPLWMAASTVQNDSALTILLYLLNLVYLYISRCRPSYASPFLPLPLHSLYI
jgi:hypothetical protein